MNAAILPVLMALLHRVYGPANRQQWRELWAQKQFPMAPLDDYFGKWYERFDLFHPQRPFYQARDERVKPKSVIHLMQSAGNTGTLFTHMDESIGLTLTPAEAARHLLVAQAFRTSGLSGIDEKFTDTIFARGVIFWAEGTTLYETLLLNLIPHTRDSFFYHQSSDAPTWEMDDPWQPRHIPRGYLDYLTWQNNRILLMPEGQGEAVCVREMTIAPGLAIDSAVKSPHKRYMRNDKKDEVSWVFLYFNEQKALWRDYYTMLPHDKDTIRPPAAVTWLSEVELEEQYPLRLMATGMLADQAKVIFYRQEQMPLPVKLLNDADMFIQIKQAIHWADEVQDALRKALNLLAEQVLMRGSTGKPNSSDRKHLTEQWDGLSLYWEQLETHFWKFINKLTENENALDTWEEVLKRTAVDILAKTERMAGNSPWALKGGVIANRALQTKLNKIFRKN
jgi:CRISPR system Cascade subunit CasA